MKRILLTGMSGTGKSTVIRTLSARGYRAVDLDEPGWSRTGPDGDWVWQEDAVQSLLSSSEEEESLFVSGCATNQVKFHSQFDEIILLSAPVDVLVSRLATRTTNSYGKHPDELAEVLGYVETVEPRLRNVASHEIDTRARLDEVVAQVIRIAQAVGE